MVSPVKYAQALRDHAKANGLRLVTISVPGLCCQWALEKEQCEKVEKLLLEIIKHQTEKAVET